MKSFLKEFNAHKFIYIIIIIGFTVFISSTTMVFSIYKVCEENASVEYNGKFKSVYSLKLKNIEDISFVDIHKLVQGFLPNCSVITGEVVEGSNFESIIGIVNYSQWIPPRTSAIDSTFMDGDSIILGQSLFNEKKEIEIDSKVYKVGAIVGIDEWHSAYDNRIYVPLDMLPVSMEKYLKRNNEINLIIRSNANIKKELKYFINEIKNIKPLVDVSLKRLNWEYFKSSISTGGAREAFSFPLRVCLIAMINGIITLYFFYYIQRRKIALEKALGASNSYIIIGIFKKLTICIIPSVIVSSLLILLLIELNFKVVGMEIVFGFSSIVIGVISTLILCLITTFISSIYVLKVQVSKILK